MVGGWACMHLVAHDGSKARDAWRRCEQAVPRHGVTWGTGLTSLHGDEALAGLRDCKGSMHAHDNEVAVADKLEAAPVCDAVDGGNEGLRGDSVRVSWQVREAGCGTCEAINSWAPKAERIYTMAPNRSHDLTTASTSTSHPWNPQRQHHRTHPSCRRRLLSRPTVPDIEEGGERPITAAHRPRRPTYPVSPTHPHCPCHPSADLLPALSLPTTTRPLPVGHPPPSLPFAVPPPTLPPPLSAPQPPLLPSADAPP